MCTALDFKTRDHYFGRNLDLERSYAEKVTVTPRNYPFHFRRAGEMAQHYAMIGMAAVADGYPLYYDATNERGLSMAGLNFPGNAQYNGEAKGKDNVTPFEFIPWILGQCDSVADARKLLARMNMLNESFSKELPLSPLHWMISDSHSCIVVESVREGLMVYDNPVGVMTNNPPFPFQLFNLNNYMNLTREIPRSRFAQDYPLDRYSLGMGAIGLPGDPSSMSRFVKAVFVRLNSVCGEGESESISQFFHILDAVEQQRGVTAVEGGKFEFTLYSSCVNTDKGIYYYKTYENNQITAIDMHREDLDGSAVVGYPLVTGQQIRQGN